VIAGAPAAGNNGRGGSGSAYVALGYGTPSFSYPAAIAATTDVPIAPLAPTVTRTGPTAFSVSPALPAGLVLDPASGVVSGTPTQIEAPTVHAVTLTDFAGTAVAVLRVTVLDVTPPTIVGFSFLPKRFALGARRTVATAALRRGTTIRFTLSERAMVRITIARKLPGRRSGKRCVKPTRKLRARRRCTRHVTVAKLIRRDRQPGRRTLAFTGRIGTRALKPAEYRATITATDLSANQSTPKKATFTVKRR
jgi:putative Ig domain-containing protein